MAKQDDLEFSDYGRPPRQSVGPTLVAGLMVWVIIAGIFAYLVVHG